MKLHRVIVQIEAPKGDFPGRTAEGRYTLEDDVVTLTSHAGIPVRDNEGNTYSKKIDAGEDPHVIAGRLTKQFRKALRGDKTKTGFSSPINYPRSGIA